MRKDPLCRHDLHEFLQEQVSRALHTKPARTPVRVSNRLKIAYEFAALHRANPGLVYTLLYRVGVPATEIGLWVRPANPEEATPPNTRDTRRGTYHWPTTLVAPSDMVLWAYPANASSNSVRLSVPNELCQHVTRALNSLGYYMVAYSAKRHLNAKGREDVGANDTLYDLYHFAPTSANKVRATLNLTRSTLPAYPGACSIDVLTDKYQWPALLAHYLGCIASAQEARLRANALRRERIREIKSMSRGNLPVHMEWLASEHQPIMLEAVAIQLASGFGLAVPLPFLRELMGDRFTFNSALLQDDPANEDVLWFERVIEPALQQWANSTQDKPLAAAESVNGDSTVPINLTLAQQWEKGLNGASIWSRVEAIRNRYRSDATMQEVRQWMGAPLLGRSAPDALEAPAPAKAQAKAPAQVEVLSSSDLQQALTKAQEQQALDALREIEEARRRDEAEVAQSRLYEEWVQRIQAETARPGEHDNLAYSLGVGQYSVPKWVDFHLSWPNIARYCRQLDANLQTWADLKQEVLALPLPEDMRQALLTYYTTKPVAPLKDLARIAPTLAKWCTLEQVQHLPEVHQLVKDGYTCPVAKPDEWDQAETDSRWEMFCDTIQAQDRETLETPSAEVIDKPAFIPPTGPNPFLDDSPLEDDWELNIKGQRLKAEQEQAERERLEKEERERIKRDVRLPAWAPPDWERYVKASDRPLEYAFLITFFADPRASDEELQYALRTAWLEQCHWPVIKRLLADNATLLHERGLPLPDWLQEHVGKPGQAVFLDTAMELGLPVGEKAAGAICRDLFTKA